jgi:3-hydroxymyristoyl/3-hydroxydecanoyl-(acyl carrier protein) dehydratase
MITTTFQIDASHPSLSGHFPGNPIVPGVVLLDRVAAEVERGLNARLRTLPQVKFMRPLKPEERACLTIDYTAPTGRFVIKCGDEVVAKGTFEVSA